MKKLGLATALLLAMTGAHAYQVEVQGHFKNVDSSKGPLAEAAFLNQASNVSVAYSFSKLSGDEVPTEKTNAFGAKGEAYLPTPYLPVYTSASYSHTQTKTDGKKDNGDRFALEIGTMLTPNFLVAVGYTNIADQVALDANSVLSNGIFKSAAQAEVIGEDQDAITARTKYVGNIDGTNMAIGFETGLVYGENKAYGLKTDLYLTPKLSVGASQT